MYYDIFALKSNVLLRFGFSCINISESGGEIGVAAMEEEFHFDATPIAPPGSEMLMHKNFKPKKDIWFQCKKDMVHRTMFPTLPNI